MDFAELWAKYGPAVAFIEIMVVPFAGKIWDAILGLLKTMFPRFVNQRIKQTEREYENHKAERSMLVLELKEILTEYRERAQAAERTTELVRRREMDRMVSSTREWIELVRANERREAKVVEALIDVSNVLRHVLAALEKLNGGRDDGPD